MMSIGVKRISAITMLWVGPLCWSPGMRRSTSGSNETSQISGILKFSCVILLTVFAAKYPKAMCPSRYIWIKSSLSQSGLFIPFAYAFLFL